DEVWRWCVDRGFRCSLQRIVYESWRQILRSIHVKLALGTGDPQPPPPVTQPCEVVEEARAQHIDLEQVGMSGAPPDERRGTLKKRFTKIIEEFLADGLRRSDDWHCSVAILLNKFARLVE